MANEIDLYKDLKEVEKMLKNCSWENKPMWLAEKKKIIKEIKEMYPDLAI